MRAHVRTCLFAKDAAAAPTTTRPQRLMPRVLRAQVPAPASAEALRAWDGISLDAWPELKAAAAEQLGETDATKAVALPALRAKLNALPEEERPTDVSDANLLRHLRGRKFRVEEACAHTHPHALMMCSHRSRSLAACCAR
jgi:hypothetical protein